MSVKIELAYFKITDKNFKDAVVNLAYIFLEYLFLISK